MKKISFAIACIVVLSALTVSAVAQTRQLAQAEIPFSFTAHDQVFAPGTYEIQQLGAQTLRLQNVASKTGITLITVSPVTVTSSVKLGFHQYGSQRFLRSVGAPDVYTANVAMSSGEREIAKSHPSATKVALLAKR